MYSSWCYRSISDVKARVIRHNLFRKGLTKYHQSPGDKVPLRELSAYGRLKMLCLYVARNMTKYPLMGGVCLKEVSISGRSTVP